MLEDDNYKLCWDLEYNMRKTTTARRPDVTIEDKNGKKIWIIDMACPSEKNVSDKYREKLQKYQQLAFELRERRPGYVINIMPVILGCLGGGMVRLEDQISKVINGRDRVSYISAQMLKAVLFESESIVRKVLSGLIQSE